MNAFVSKRLILIFEGIEAKFYKDWKKKISPQIYSSLDSRKKNF